MNRPGRGLRDRRRLALALLAMAGAAAAPANAAPLDALLTATPERSAPTATLELAVDRLNRQLDFSKPDPNDPSSLTTTTGDYRGGHLAGAVRVANGLWLSGSLWQRTLGDDIDTFRYQSWQASGLYRFIDGGGAVPALALRLSAWGNRAKVTETTTPVRVPGAILDSVTVSQPSDRQLQADLIGTWKLSSSLDLSAQLGGGSTRLDYAALTATTRRNGCSYKLSFTGNDIFGELAGTCNASGGVIRQFFDSSGDYGVDVAKEIAWRGRFAQAGLNLAWRDGPWALQGGFLLHLVRRDDVDNILASRASPVYRRNQIIALEAGYDVSQNLGVFARSELSSHLFLHDLPVTYNTSTSGRFGSRFSLFSLGLRARF